MICYQTRWNGYYNFFIKFLTQPGIISSEKPTRIVKWCFFKISGKCTIIWHKTELWCIIKCSNLSFISYKVVQSTRLYDMLYLIRKVSHSGVSWQKDGYSVGTNKVTWFDYVTLIRSNSKKSFVIEKWFIMQILFDP